MKTSKRFDNAISKLVKAFFEGTLSAGNCTHCAVGNIVGSSKWSHIFFTPVDSKEQIFLEAYHADAYGGYESCVRETEACGYSIAELALVEQAFERATLFKAPLPFLKIDHTIEKIMQDQYNGLMAVVDVLCEIEGIGSKEYKDMFSYTEDFKPVNAL